MGVTEVVARSNQLMAHQKEGVEFLLSRQSGLLAFEQGLGKTLVAIQAFCQLIEDRKADQMLVICPNSLKRNWVHEIAKFASHLTTRIIEGAPKERRRQLATANERVVIVSYETARSEIAGVLSLLAQRRAVLVLDESHAVKNRRSLTSIAAQHFAPRTEYRWLLSGTPITNTAADLFTQINVVAGGPALGTYESFTARYGDADAADALRARIQPYLLRRTKNECLDLPDKTFYDVYVELPAWQRELYDSMRDALVCEIQGLSGEQFRAFAPTALSRILRLSQLASNPSLLLPESGRIPAKFLELDELVEEICGGAGEKVILWSNYVKSIQALLDRYSRFGAVALYGEIAVEDRLNIVDQFQSDPQMRLLVANPAAAGTGFTLTAARYAIYESLSWRYDHYAQSQDRNHRIGQTRPVTYMRIVAADTIEEAIVSALERKSDLARALLGDVGASPLISALSRQQMCDLLLYNQLPDD